MAKIATVTGTALVPGISKNGRLYTAETIAKAVQRAQERINGGGHPLTMLSHHAADDDSTRICGRITALSVAEDGSAKFTADLADTDHARTIASLVSGDTPYLKGVSIRGAWVGKVRREVVDGQHVECAPELELHGLDFTKSPGVPGAGIESVTRTGGPPSESEDGRHLIYESAEALVTLTEDMTGEQTVEAAATADKTKPYGDVQYADPGYQDDKKKRYPLDSKSHAKSAWSFINQADNAKLYTANQLKRIKGRIKAALKKFGVQVAAENWLIDTADAVTESGSVNEYYTDMYGDGPGTFCLNATNGPLSVTISSTRIDPADLEYILKAIVDSTVMAMKNIDPDMDGDMDVPGADAEDTDDDMETSAESAPAEPVSEAEPTPEPPVAPEPAEETEDPAPEPAAANPDDKEEPAMADPTTQAAAEPTPAATTENTEQPSALDALNAKFDKLTDAISGLVTKMAPAPAVAAESAPQATTPAQETAPAAPPAEAPVVETQEQMVARLVAEGIAAARTELVQEMVESGNGPTRKGLVAPVNEHRAQTGTSEWPEGWPTENGSPKPLHKFDSEERRLFGPYLQDYVLGSKAR